VVKLNRSVLKILSKYPGPASYPNLKEFILDLANLTSTVDPSGEEPTETKRCGILDTPETGRTNPFKNMKA